ncbi:MAG: hypothetical protein KC492_05410 [Myxococcales bacterium]|nr:hypothetical protein [Myxococcales bacterium]
MMASQGNVDYFAGWGGRPAPSRDGCWVAPGAGTDGEKHQREPCCSQSTRFSASPLDRSLRDVLRHHA